MGNLIKRRRYGAYLIGIPLLVAAAFLAYYGDFVISLAFEPAQDSPDVTYWTVGGIALMLSACIAGLGLLTLATARRKWGWLLACQASLVAAAIPYVRILGMPGYTLHACFAGIAIGAALAFISDSARSRQDIP